MIFQNCLAGSVLNNQKCLNLSSESLKLSVDVSNFNLNQFSDFLEGLFSKTAHCAPPGCTPHLPPMTLPMYDSRSLLKIIQKYFQACQTFWSFYNFRKNVCDLRALQVSFKNHTKIFTSLPDILKLLQLQKKCLGPQGTPGVF